MNSELMVMTFGYPQKADTVLAAIRVMRKSPILCLAAVVVANRDDKGQITLYLGQEPAGAQEERDTRVLLALAELILRTPVADAIDALADRGMHGRFVSEIARRMEGPSSALFVLARENSVHDTGETRSALTLFKGRLHETSVPPEVEEYLLEIWASNLENQK